MNNIDKIHNFVFKGFLLNSTIDEFEESGLIKKKPYKKTKRPNYEISIEDFPIALQEDAKRSSHAYIALFCFENSVRKLVSDRLKEKEGIDWWKKSVSPKIQKRVQKRIEEDKKNRWHAPRASDEIAYCDFSDLKGIIISRWHDFEDLFPSQDWIQTRLSDLEPSRNTTSHNNVLSDNDINRIEMFLRDWVLQVG